MACCATSGASIITTSAPSEASAGTTSFQPSCSACFHDAPPLRRPTTTLCPLSRRFSAWARPWLPYPMIAMRLPSSARGFASFSQNIFAILFLLRIAECLRGACDCPFGRRGNQFCVFGHDAGCVARLRLFPVSAPLVEVGVYIEPPRANVERDLISIANQC